MIRASWLGIVLFTLTACATSFTEPYPNNTSHAVPIEPQARLGSVSMITHDLDASIEFYTRYLGYKVMGTSLIDTPKPRRVVGATGNQTVRYVSLAATGLEQNNPPLTRISFIEIKQASRHKGNQNAKRASAIGDAVLAHRVVNIDLINQRIIADDIPIIAPLGLSGSGKSMSMAVLDPNGIRVEMYEY